MQEHPEFPRFRPLELNDKPVIQPYLAAYRPQTSEWTFTNLFMWRQHYRFQWSIHRDWLLVVCRANGGGGYGMGPVGPPPRLEVTRLLLDWLGQEHGAPGRIERADQRLVEELRAADEFLIEAAEEHFDYVYRSADLIQLAGRKYHAKRNHINKLLRSHAFRYEPLAAVHVPACLQLAETWCQWRRCEDDFNLLGEWDAIREALNHFASLDCQGGVIVVGDRLEAFALGELLNDDTAVVHIEKANPDIAGMYGVINQQFCEQAWSGVSRINREQDLGEPGLRKAKLSYFPDHLVKKYRIRFAGGKSRQ
jgi:uncharacterized protein